MSELLLLICSVLLGIISMLTTFVFCFWFVYILDAMRRRWKYYRNNLRSLQQEDSDSQQQILTYLGKTEFTKCIFLFFLNIVEWLGFILARVEYILNFTYQYYADVTHQNEAIKGFYIVSSITSGNMHFSLTFHSIFFLPNNILVMSLVLIASLCMYLSARSTQMSWIKSTKIPYLIGFFLLSVIATQTLASFCSTNIIANWCSILLVTVSLIIALKQYRKLQMIIGWAIVDLSISKNRKLMEQHIKMKRNFTKIFTIIWIGTLLLIVSEYMGTILLTSVIILRDRNDSNMIISLCENSNISNSEVFHGITSLFWIVFIIGLVGAEFIFIPYIGYGLSTMGVILWRLYKGKTGYKTHYHNEINAPLI